MSDRLSASFLLVAAAIALTLWWYHLGATERVALLQGRPGGPGGDASAAGAGAGTSSTPGAQPAQNGAVAPQGGIL